MIVVPIPNPERADLSAYDLLVYPAENIRKARDVKNYPFAKQLEDQRPTVWAVAIYDIPDPEDGEGSVMQLLALNQHWFSHGLCEFAAPFRIRGKGRVQSDHIAEFVERAFMTGAKTIMLRAPFAVPGQLCDVVGVTVLSPDADYTTVGMIVPGLAQGRKTIGVITATEDGEPGRMSAFCQMDDGNWSLEHGESAPPSTRWPVGWCIIAAATSKHSRAGVYQIEPDRPCPSPAGLIP